MNFGDRRDSHFSLLRNGKHGCVEMQTDFTNTGEDHFEFVVLCECEADHIDELEDEWIQRYMTRGLSYNQHGGGRSGFKGVPCSEQAKRLIGEKNRVNMTGRKASEETKRKMSASRLGKKLGPLSDERKLKSSISHSGERSKWAKLTEEQVVEMRRLRRETGMSYTQLGKQFGVTYQCVSDICNYKRWKYTA